MARLNIEENFWSERRLHRLGKKLGGLPCAVGILALLWHESQAEGAVVASSDQIEDWAWSDDLNLDEGAVTEALLKCGYISPAADGKFAIHGNQIQIDRLASYRMRAAKGGRATKAKYAKSLDADKLQLSDSLSNSLSDSLSDSLPNAKPDCELVYEREETNEEIAARMGIDLQKSDTPKAKAFVAEIVEKNDKVVKLHEADKLQLSNSPSPRQAQFNSIQFNSIHINSTQSKDKKIFGGMIKNASADAASIESATADRTKASKTCLKSPEDQNQCPDIDKVPKSRKRPVFADEDMDLALAWRDKHCRKNFSWRSDWNRTLVMEKWAEAIGKVRRDVGLSCDHVERIIDFLASGSDDFLTKNCVSPRGLLKKWKNDKRPIDAILTSLPEYNAYRDNKRWNDLEGSELSDADQQIIRDLQASC